MQDLTPSHTLGIVVPYWNLFGDQRRLDNLDRCLTQLRAAADVQVLCVEMDCGHLSGLADIVVEPSIGSKYVWQKERLINYGCEILFAENIDYFGYVDGDCLFVDPDWVANIRTQFEAGHNIVQGFSRAVDECNSAPAALAAFPELGSRLHGGSMFVHRELYLKIGGLYEHCIVGGGDFVFLMAATGALASFEWIFPNQIYQEHFTLWMDRFSSFEIRPACADNAVNILSHGNPQRSHRMRHALLPDFDPEVDILRGDTLGLTEKGKRLLPRLRAYCSHREDRADIILGTDSTSS